MDIKQVVADITSEAGVNLLIGDVHSAKSNTLYAIAECAKSMGEISMYVYGLRCDVRDSVAIHSVAELEECENSLILADELGDLFDMRNQRERNEMERTLRLVKHNNNALVFCGVPENFKKFLSAKADRIGFKQTSIADCVNGSHVKKVLTAYKGIERGQSKLKLAKDTLLWYDGKHYHHVKVPYMREYDTKANNEPILKKK